MPSRKPFKPRVRWAVFQGVTPIDWSIRYSRSAAIEEFLRQMSLPRSWAEYEVRGYTVGKVLVSPVEAAIKK